MPDIEQFCTHIECGTWGEFYYYLFIPYYYIRPTIHRTNKQCGLPLLFLSLSRHECQMAHVKKFNTLDGTYDDTQPNKTSHHHHHHRRVSKLPAALSEALMHTHSQNKRESICLRLSTLSPSWNVLLCGFWCWVCAARGEGEREHDVKCAAHAQYEDCGIWPETTLRR